jgi:uncharacterized protein (TIGR01777 family)
MRIVIAGGTGFIGSPLAEVYAEEGHDVRVLTRGLPDGEARHDPGTGMPGITRVGWRPIGSSGRWASIVDDADAVINLAGEPLGARRWTPQRKAALRDSRILATRSIVEAIRGAAKPPRVLINSSGTGYYGASGAEPKTEDSPPGDDFLSHLAVDWEAEAVKAEGTGARVVPLRTGVVLEKTGGALPQMMRPFRFFVGGPIGGGRQYMSWIHRLDVIEMIRWIVETPAVIGPVNATAPHPVTNRELARALGRALRRPSLLPAPAFALKAMLGEMAGPLLLTGHRAVPARALAHGYHFRYPEIDIAMRGIFGE